jgi:hypothetical protein
VFLPHHDQGLVYEGEKPCWHGLTLWKKNWPRKEAQKNKESPNLISGLKKEITVMRKQGEPPVKEPNSFAHYMCDICSTPTR